MSQKFFSQYTRRLIFSGFLFLLLGMSLFHVLTRAHADQSVTVPNTIFLDTTGATMNITTVGSAGAVSYTINDSDNVAISSGSYQATSPQMTLTLPPVPDGYYTLNIVDHTTQAAPHQSIPFAVIAPPPSGMDSPFGLGVHLQGNEAGMVQLMTRLGAVSVRSDATWAQIEQRPGQYNFNNYDPALQVFQQNAFNPLLILDYNNRFYDNGQTPYDDAGLKAFANYAKAVVSHYGPQLKAVEIYNEYNGLFSNGPCARNPKCYTRMLQYSYQAIKSVRPDVTVIGGAVFAADLLWFARLFQDGGLRYMDAVSDHPYTLGNFLSFERAGTSSELKMLQTLIKLYNHGVAKPLWITEFGWPTSFLNADERMQAEYLVRGAVLSLAAGAQKLFWYDFLNDGVSSYNPEKNFGLLRSPDASGRYTPKPSYVAYATLIRQLAHRGFISGGEIGPGIYDERFGSMHVLWSTTSGKIVVKTNSPVTVTSLFGKSQRYLPVSGHLILPVSEDPIYLSADASSQVAELH